MVFDLFGQQGGPGMPGDDGGPLAGLQDTLAGVLDSADPRHPVIPGPAGSFLAWPGRQTRYQAPAQFQPQGGQHRSGERLTPGEAGLLFLAGAAVLAVIAAISIVATIFIH